MANDYTKSNEYKSGSIFWILFIMLSFSGLVYLGIWGFHNGSVKAIAISVIFSVLIIFSIIITRFEIFKLEMDFLKSCQSFTIGFVFFMLIAGFLRVMSGQKFLYSLFAPLQLQKNSLFATISGELPLFWDKYVNNITIPIAEEMFWLIALPIATIWLMNSISKMSNKLQFFENNVFQLIAVIIISGGTFAIFHVGSVALMAFIISAMVFRTILLLFVQGDLKFGWFSALGILPSFAVGSHMANNMMEEGLMNFLIILKSEAFGIGLIILFIIIFILGILEILDNFIPNWDFGKNEGRR